MLHSLLLQSTFRSLKRAKLLTTAVSSSDSTDLVYRAEERYKPLVGDHKLPIREQSVSSGDVDTLVSSAEMLWSDLDADAARAHVMAGGSLALYGLPGTGKSTMVRAWVEELRGLGKKVCCIGKTHNSVSILQTSAGHACTCHHFIYK